MNDPIAQAQELAKKGKAKELLALMKKTKDEMDKEMIGMLYETALINGNR